MVKNSNFYRYNMSAIDILIPEMDPIRLSNANILGLRIEKDYDNLFFPIMSIQLLLDYSLYYTIVKNKTNIKFKIKLEKFKYQGDGRTINYKEVIFDELFTTFIDDDSFFIDEDAYKRAKTITENTLTGGVIEFYLFKESAVNASRKVMNRVIQDANMTNVITYLLSNGGYTDVLMSPLENYSSYNEIVLLPTTIIQNLSYLEKRYGFYNNGSVIFFDFNTTYILNRKSTVTAFRPNEFTKVTITCFKSINSNFITTGSYKDEELKTFTLHVSQNNIQISTTTIVEDMTYGTDLTLVSATSNTNKKITPDVQSINKNKKVLTNNFDNKFLPTILENYKIENDGIIQVNVVDFDTELLGPNKQYLLSFEDVELQKKYGENKSYRLSSETLVFEKSGDQLSLNAVLIFKKTR